MQPTASMQTHSHHLTYTHTCTGVLMQPAASMQTHSHHLTHTCTGVHMQLAASMQTHSHHLALTTDVLSSKQVGEAFKDSSGPVILFLNQDIFY